MIPPESTPVEPEAVPEQAPGKRSQRTIWLAAAIVAILAFGIVALFTLVLNQEYTIEGTLEAPSCTDGYDIEFASIDVRDESGDLIGSSSSGPGDYTSDGQYGLKSFCVVDFSVDVGKAEFYEITIGTHGGPSYSFDELESREWKVELSLD